MDRSVQTYFQSCNDTSLLGDHIHHCCVHSSCNELLDQFT